MDYRIEQTGGHYVVYDSCGQFLFSADTRAEALSELRSA